MMTPLCAETDQSSVTLLPSVLTRPAGSSWLFVKERFAWPRASGHDVHTYGMMRALAEQGHSVSLLTVDEPPDEAIAGIQYANRYCLSANQPPVPPADQCRPAFSKSQAKFSNYWGISEDRIRQVGAAAQHCQADVVVVSGLNVLPYLGAVTNAARVWYAADEWVWHHLSMVRPLRPKTWNELKPAIVKGWYERAYRPMLEKIWVVTEADARAFRVFAGMPRCDVIPNGIDADHYRPHDTDSTPESCAFWGRLDFGPNQQALEWFAQQIWPRVLERHPKAVFRVIGFHPTTEVVSICSKPGIELMANVPDIRTAVQSSQVAVLPFVSGGGIKNKLLEAAALGMPIISTSRATLGLKGTPPFVQTDRVGEWVEQLSRLWNDGEARRELGRDARDWVVSHHSWPAAAQAAVDGLRLAGALRQGSSG